MTLYGFYKEAIMFRAVICGTEVRIGLLFPAVLVVLFALDDTGIPAWCLAASAMHEAGHFIAMYLLGCRPSMISISGFGVRARLPAKKYQALLKRDNNACRAGGEHRLSVLALASV